MLGLLAELAGDSGSAAAIGFLSELDEVALCSVAGAVLCRFCML